MSESHSSKDRTIAGVAIRFSGGDVRKSFQQGQDDRLYCTVPVQYTGCRLLLVKFRFSNSSLLDELRLLGLIEMCHFAKITMLGGIRSIL